MKKVLGIALVALLVTACSKKEENPNKETNIMLQEPKVEMTTETTEVVNETADVVKEQTKEEVKDTPESSTEEAK